MLPRIRTLISFGVLCVLGGVFLLVAVPDSAARPPAAKVRMGGSRLLPANCRMAYATPAFEPIADPSLTLYELIIGVTAPQPLVE